MIVVDTSAIVALLLGEPTADRIDHLLTSNPVCISAPNWVEACIVIQSRAGAEGMALLNELRQRVDLRIHTVDASIAEEAAIAWRRFGKGRHRAALNFGDTFSYALARVLGVDLLFVGDDFGRTDISVA